jgi:hypothetical protein
MDLSNLAPLDSPIDMEVLHPTTRKPIGLTLSVYGTDSGVYRSAAAQRSERRLKMMKGGRTNLTSEEIEEDAMNILIVSTAGWVWGKDAAGVPCSFHGEMLAFNRANVDRVFRALPWIPEQVDAFMGDRSNFFTKEAEHLNSTVSGSSD